jgi:hypothetical protein
MKYSTEFLEKMIVEYINDNDAFGNEEEDKVITETLNGFKPLLTENAGSLIPSSLLQEHAEKLKGVPKEVFEDFMVYVNMTSLDFHLL